MDPSPTNQQKENTEVTPNELPEKLPLYAHALAGWPLILLFLGGAIGGLCGGGAYGLSLMLLKKKGVTPLSCFLSALIGIGSVVLCFVIVAILVLAFPDTFGKSDSQTENLRSWSN
jgi:hypothetical protein